MIKNLPAYFKFSITPLFCFAIGLNASAQKLPNTQQGSVFAPATIRIDGKATEWAGKFEAYNHATDVFYTIANDEENLYLIVQATKPRIIDKIIDVGLTFLINTSGKAQDKEALSVTYPDIDVAHGQRIIISAGNKIRSDVAIPQRNGKPIVTDTIDLIPKRNDSLIKIANDMFGINAKTITVKGFTAFPDELISIYNEEKIRVAAAFSREGFYTYELAIPLKYLQLPANTPQKLAYGIRLNSRLIKPKSGMTTRYIYPNGQATDVDQDLDSTTDFWAEYTLAKNP